MAERRERGPEPAEPPPPGDLLAQIITTGTGAEQTLLDAFARQLWSRGDAAGVSAEEVAALAGMTRNAFRFVSDRGLQRMAVRVYTPTLDAYGWESPDTVIEAVLDDRPFIVDTLRDAIQTAGGEIRRLLHPIIGVERDARGLLTHVGPPEPQARRESFFHCEVSHLPATAEIEAALTDRLTDVILVTNDYQAMRERVRSLAAELRANPPSDPWANDLEETALFLEWLGQKSFVFLGYREYDIAAYGSTQRAVVHAGSGLGLLRREERSRYRTAQPLAGDLWQRLNQPPVLIVSKTDARSPIHRTVPMDYIGIKRVDARGVVTGERRLLGLFTSKAHHEDAAHVPILRRQLQTILTQEGAVEESHDYKDLEAVYNSFPKEELFASRTDEIRRAVRAIIAAESQMHVHVLCHQDAFQHGLFVVVSVPQRRFSTELHRQIGARLLSHLEASVLHEHLALDERTLVRLHYYLAVPFGVLQNPPVAALEYELNDLLRSWEDALREHLSRGFPPAEADRIVAKYQGVFPVAYRAATEPSQAVRDLRCIEHLAASGEAQYELYDEVRGEPGVSALKLYLTGERLVLSEFIPELEHLGLRVFGQGFVDLAVPDLGTVRIHTFFVQDAARNGQLNAVRVAPLLLPALRAVRKREVENDALNRLVLAAGLEWRAIDLLRAYVEHARQTGVASRPALVEALVANPESAKRLVALFAAKFDPVVALDATDRLPGPVAQAEEAFRASVEQVQSLSHDRALRALGLTLTATVRTNFYRPPSDGPWDPAIAIKIESARVPHLAPPRPLYEVYVHGVRVEGIHLRAGHVARGGIRSSDRPDDFRTEILGLMKTQVVKNAVIVPVGAKGGFVVKRRPGESVARPEIERAYATLVASLLSITDNFEQGLVISPPGLVISDGPDPYLVVAADKGTAQFSDLANRVAARHQFWLGDAFASGGAQGYDHKKLGITARGAWECVRQHFREMGRDPDRQPVAVIGIGDMSGDVFGNGMLLSHTIRLRAAFNHLHIFLDPDPDPERSFAERERLFRLPTSTWSDYDPTALSSGGGVFLRSAKAVALAPTAQVMLRLEQPLPSGEEVVRAILRMEADLLWNGGVGTYLKATDELHTEVGDPGNDGVRVNAADLRVQVVAEGGNLGLTQRARVELALAGRRINTDAIDNSAGVDLSDHEVNLKITLQAPVQNREISMVERNAVLVEVTDEVCAAVLSHNRRQALLLARDQTRSRRDLLGFRDLVALLEAEAGLDRQLERLPTREDLRARRGTYLGLTRPELAVLSAYAKLHLRARLLDSSLVDEASTDRYLRNYFPRVIGERFGHILRHHSLRREITAAEVANRLIDLMGTTFLVRAVRDTGRPLIEVVRAWMAAAAITGSDDIVRLIESATPERLPPEAEQLAYQLHETALEDGARWIVATQRPTTAPTDLAETLARPVRQLLGEWPDHLDGDVSARYRAAVQEVVDRGAPVALAESLVRLKAIVDILEISQLAAELRLPLGIVAHAYFRTGALADLDWVRRSLTSLATADDRWQQRAVEGLLEGVLSARRHLTLNVLAGREGRVDVDECLQQYAETHQAPLDALRRLIDDLKAVPQPPLAALLVVMRELEHVFAE